MDRTVKILVVLFAVLGIGLFLYHWISQWHSQSLEQAVTEEKENCLQRLAQLEAQINKLSEGAETKNPGALSNSEMGHVFGTPKPESTDCAKISSQVAAFFQYLDSKAYLIWPGVHLQADELFEETYQALVSKPPTNVGELDNLYNLIHNVTHLYRVLGKDRLELLKTILSSESEVLEPAMAVMFAWLVTCSDSGPSDRNQKSLQEIYPYASYFLNTLGGRSYLLRRDSKLRMLVNYYSVRLLDMANERKLNAYGVDIRPYLEYLFYDINNQKGLMYRERYLSQLAALIDKYQ